MQADKDMAEKVIKSLVQCAKKEYSTVSNVEKILISSFNDHVTFGTIDTVINFLNTLIEKTKCTLDVIEKMSSGTELSTPYKKFQADVAAILKNDVIQCAQTEGFIEMSK